VLSKIPTLGPSWYWNFKNVTLSALLNGFVNTSDWPLCFRLIRYVCDWLQWSTLQKHVVNRHQWRSSPSAYTDTHGSVWKQQRTARCLFSNAPAFKMLSSSNTSVSFQTLPCVDHCSQSQTYMLSAWTQWPIRGVYESAQQCSKRHIFKISLLTSIEVGTFDNASSV